LPRHRAGAASIYGALADLITSWKKHRLRDDCRRLKVLTHSRAAGVDEIGYLPLSRTGAMPFFQLDDPPLGARVHRAHVQ